MTTISISHNASFHETLAKGWSPTTFTSRRPIPWATPKGFSPPSRDRPFSDAEPFIVCRGSSSMPPSILHPGHILYVCTFSTNSFQTFSMLMPNRKPELGSSWISLGKLVSRRESHTSTCGCTLILDQETRTRVLGWQEWVKQPQFSWWPIPTYYQTLAILHNCHLELIC
jgi:hypothetical protein